MDDIQIVYHYKNISTANNIISGIKTIYKLRDLSNIKWFLGIQIICNQKIGKLWLVYNIYIEKIVKKFNFNNNNTYISLLIIEFVKYNENIIIIFIQIY